MARRLKPAAARADNGRVQGNERKNVQEPHKYPKIIRDYVVHAYAAALTARESYRDFEKKIKEHHPQVAQSLKEDLDSLNTDTDRALAAAGQARNEADKKQSED